MGFQESLSRFYKTIRRRPRRYPEVWRFGASGLLGDELRDGSLSVYGVVIPLSIHLKTQHMRFNCPVMLIEQLLMNIVCRYSGQTTHLPAREFEGATKQVRFSPRFGKYLAAALGISVNSRIFILRLPVMTCMRRKKTSFGDPNMTFPICWDTSGKYFTSLGEDHARIWSTASSRKFIFELKSNGNKFESCTFHPEY